LETLGKLVFSDSTVFCSAITFFQILVILLLLHMHISFQVIMS